MFREINFKLPSDLPNVLKEASKLELDLVKDEGDESELENNRLFYSLNDEGLIKNIRTYDDKNVDGNFIASNQKNFEELYRQLKSSGYEFVEDSSDSNNKTY
jgi:glycerophosphoryl diester phosphodiesterase